MVLTNDSVHEEDSFPVPCGSCAHFMSQFGDFEVHLVKKGGQQRQESSRSLAAAAPVPVSAATSMRAAAVASAGGGDDPLTAGLSLYTMNDSSAENIAQLTMRLEVLRLHELLLSFVRSMAQCGNVACRSDFRSPVV